MLSIVGTVVVMLACSFPEANRKRPATQLIFWLSLADFCAAVVYLLASFEASSEENTPWCKATALLGIFFPVASFLWTDFIAFYLYSIILWNRFRTSSEWSKLMRKFHIYSWGIAGLCITLVGSFSRAGKSPDSNDNTGGWCWVHAPTKTELFVWELVGGKLVEWSSAFIILPYFYAFAAQRLVNLENSSKVGDHYVSGQSASSVVSASIASPSSPKESVDVERMMSNESAIGRRTSTSASRQSTGGMLQFKQFYIKMVSAILFVFILCLTYY